MLSHSCFDCIFCIQSSYQDNLLFVGIDGQLLLLVFCMILYEIRWMFEGLQRLLRNNYRFTLSDKTRRNIRDSVADNCNAFDFLADQSAAVFGTEFSVTCSDLYGVYEWWCRDNALTALKRDSFISILKANANKWNISYDYNVINDQGKRVRGFKGMKTVYKVRPTVGV